MSIFSIAFRVFLASSAGLALLNGAIAGAGGVDGSSGAGGVTITIVQTGGADVIHAQGGGADDGCTYGLAIGPPGFIPDLGSVGPKPPDAQLAVLTCNGVAVGLTWVGPHNTVDLADAARQAAQRWVQTIPVPEPRIHANPPRFALVGLDTSFWLDPRPPATITDQVEAFGITVDVRMSASGVTWMFGDGTSLLGGPGRAWPAESDVRHTYQDSGRPAVTARLRLDPAYRLAGGAWLGLPAIPLETATVQPVREAQARLVG